MKANKILDRGKYLRMFNISSAVSIKCFGISTRFMYCQYKAFVLRVQRLSTASTKALYCGIMVFYVQEMRFRSNLIILYSFKRYCESVL